MKDFPRPDWTNVLHRQRFHGDSGAFAGDKLNLNSAGVRVQMRHHANITGNDPPFGKISHYHDCI